MQVLDPSEEWLRLTELYRQLTDDELLDLARERSELTDFALPILTQEMSHRGLAMPKESVEEPPQLPEPDSDDPYAEDRKLETLFKVWSMRDAFQVQSLLDTAGIPFFMGPEKATGVDKITSNFAEGLDVQIMHVGWPWARQALQHYEPFDEPNLPEEKEPEELEIRCPKCGSEEIVFGKETTMPGSSDGPRSKYEWSCDSCGHQWGDDGVVKEA